MTSIITKCPHCGADLPQMPAETVFSTLPPKVTALRRGKYFAGKCPACSGEVQRYRNVTYRDMNTDAVIHFMCALDDEELQKAVDAKAAEIAERLKNMPGAIAGMAGMGERIVTDERDLQEKVMIAAAGLDDRYVEIMKALLIEECAEEMPDMKIASMRFYCGDDKKKYLATFDEAGESLGALPFVDEVYASMKEDFEAETLPASPSVDTVWAAEVLG